MGAASWLVENCAELIFKILLEAQAAGKCFLWKKRKTGHWRILPISTLWVYPFVQKSLVNLSCTSDTLSRTRVNVEQCAALQ